MGDAESGPPLLKKSWPCRHCTIWVDCDTKTSTERREQCCGGVQGAADFFCCICSADCGERFGDGSGDLPWCRHCDARWTRLRLLEANVRKDAKFDRSQGVDDFLDCMSATRALVGPSLQYRLDLLLAHTLLQHKVGIVALVTIIRHGGLRHECHSDAGVACVLTAQGKLKLAVSDLERRAGLEEGRRPTNGSRRLIPSDLRICRLAGGITALDPYLTSIDVSGSVNLRDIRPLELASMPSLEAFDCKRCPRLESPPSSIAEQGGVAVLTFFKSVKSEGKLSRAQRHYC